MKKKSLSLLLLMFVLLLVGCSKAISIQTIKTTVGNYKIGFKGEYKREIELKEDNDGFYIKNQNGDRVVNATYLYGGVISGGFNIDHKTINDTEYICVEDGNGKNYLTYLGKYGADIGICFNTEDESEMEYIHLSGKSIAGDITSVDEYFTFGTEDNSKSDSEFIYAFNNGNTFVSSLAYTEVEPDNEEFSSYVIDENSRVNLLIADMTLSDSADGITEFIKENSDIVPVTTINTEGIYITGVTYMGLSLTFLTEGKDGYIYILDYMTVDSDTAEKNMYQLVDDLLSSGITKVNQRVKYEAGETDTIEEPEVDTNTEYTEVGFAGKLPIGYEVTYDCEYFTSYSNDVYELTFYDEIEKDIEKIKLGEKSTIISETDYKISTNDITVKNQSVWILEAERREMDVFTYYAITESGQYIRFSEVGGYKMSIDSIEELLTIWL